MNPKANHPASASAGRRAKNHGIMKSKRMNTTFGITENRIVVKRMRTESLWKKPICSPTSASRSSKEGTHHRMASAKGHSLTPRCQSQMSGNRASPAIPIIYKKDLKTLVITFFI